MTHLDSTLKSRDITLPTNVHLVKAMVFSVVMYGCESWTLKKLSTKELMLLNSGVGEDSWESLELQGDQDSCLDNPLNRGECQVTVRGVTKSQTWLQWLNTTEPKGNQSWIFIGRTDAEAETPILGPPDAKNWLIGKDPEAGKDWRQEEKGTTEDEMVGWHTRLDGHEF